MHSIGFDRRFLTAVVLLVLSVSIASAQTTVFTYQGKLSDGVNPAGGSYDMQFNLFDTATVGTGVRKGPTITNPSVQVTAGIFSVQLDFGLSAFNGQPRFLEISVRLAGSPDPYTVLSPRQPVTSTPYSVRSLNASAADVLSSACVGCVTSTQVGSVSGSAVTGTIPVASIPGGSGNYVQNTTSQQSASNFSISGDGTVGGTLSGGVVNAATQINIAGGRVLGVTGTANLFAGYNSGTNNTGSNNSFFGPAAGALNTTGGSNSYFGTQAGASNSTGVNNAVFGYHAGFENQADDNSFFGYRAGESNTFGGGNAFFGSGAGTSNTFASSNAFFGFHAGAANTTGDSNAFFGREAGAANTTGHLNSFVGNLAGMSNTTGTSDTFFGADAGADNTTGNDNSFFGKFAGVSNTTASQNSFFGKDAGGSITTGSNNSYFGAGVGEIGTTSANNSFFGTEAGRQVTNGSNNVFFGYQAGFDNDSGTFNVFVGTFAGNTNTTGDSNTIVGNNADVASGNLNFATAIGAQAVVNTSNTIVLGRSAGQDAVRVPGNLTVATIVGGGIGGLCLNDSHQIAACGSSLRYKTAVRTFSGGLDIVRRLRPIAFTWKEGGMHDVGFGAEEVEGVEPLLTTRNSKGEIEGVKYGQVTTVLVNAVKEQQTQIEAQQRTIEQQQQRLNQQQTQIGQQQMSLRRQQDVVEALKNIVCHNHSRAKVCK